MCDILDDEKKIFKKKKTAKSKEKLDNLDNDEKVRSRKYQNKGKKVVYDKYYCLVLLIPASQH